MNAQTETSELLWYALQYSSRDWPVFPCHWVENGQCSCGNPKCSSPGKHPLTSNGFKDATTDWIQLETWWAKYPNANIGIVTGNKLVAIDIDPDKGGAESFERLEAESGPLPANCPYQKTGGGGWHYLLNSEGIRSRTGIRPGIDVRGDGGYIIAPPSSHISGNNYRWRIEPNGTLPELPSAWIKILSTPKPHTNHNGDKIPEGARNDELTRIAGGLRRQGLTAEQLYDALRTINQTRCMPPLEGGEVRRIAESVGRYPAGTFFEADIRFDDIGNSERLVRQHGDTLRFVHAWNCWLVWDGSVWCEDRNAVRVGELAKDISRELYGELATGGHDDDKAKWARQSATRGRIDAAIALARGMDGVLIAHDDLDNDPYALGVENGWIKLHTGEFCPADPTKLITLQASVRYDPDATCPRWNQAITEWFPNSNTRQYVQRLVGQAVLGCVRDHIFVIHFGDGGNGKTTFIRVLMCILGAYATTVDLELVTETRHAAHDAATSVLFRRRLAVASETNRRVRLAEAQVKNLTGGDAIPARRLYENPWSFMPTHSLWLQTNYLPEISGRDTGIWRRIRVVPWTRSFDGRADDTLDEQLRSEGPGILNWIIEGARLYLAEGLNEPDEVISATADYRKREDLFGRWIEDSGFIFDVDSSTTAQTLAESWRDWTQTLFGKPRRFNDVADFLRASCCTKERETSGKRITYWKGIGLE